MSQIQLKQSLSNPYQFGDYEQDQACGCVLSVSKSMTAASQLKITAIGLYGRLRLFGEGLPNVSISEIDKEVTYGMMWQYLPFLEDLAEVVKDIRVTIKDLLLHLNALHKNKFDFGQLTRPINLLKTLMDLMNIQLIVEELVISNDYLRPCWQIAKPELMQNQSVRSIVVSIDERLFRADYIKCTAQLFTIDDIQSANDPMLELLGNVKLAESLLQTSCSIMASLLQSKSAVTISVDESLRLIGAVQLVLLLWQLYPSLQYKNAKINKALLEICAKFPYLHLREDVPLVTYELLMQQCPLLFRKSKITAEQCQNLLRACCQFSDDDLRKSVSEWQKRVASLQMHLSRKPSSNISAQDYLDSKQLVHMEALRYCVLIKKTVCDFIGLHCACQQPISYENAVRLCELVQILQKVHGFISNSQLVIYQVYIVRHLSVQLAVLLYQVKKNVSNSSKNAKYSQLLDLMIACLYNNPSLATLDVIKFGFDLISGLEVMKKSLVQQFRLLLSRLELFMAFTSQLESSADLAEVFYFNNVIIDALFQQSQRDMKVCALLPDMLSVARKSGEYLKQSCVHLHQDVKVQIIDQFWRSIQLLWKDFVKFISLEIENELRITAVLGDFNADFKQDIDFVFGVFDNEQFITRLDHCIFLRQEVEQCMVRSFYDYQMSFPKDAEIYTEMKRLALVQYGIDINKVPSGLPKLESFYSVDTDIYQIIVDGKLEQFLNDFQFDWVSQSFVSKSHQAGNLTVLSSCDINDCSRIHGSGIKNTLLSALYSTMDQSLQSIGDLVRDEYLYSCILSFAKQYNDKCIEYDMKVPYDMLLSLMHKVEPHLTKYASLINKIGNTFSLFAIIDQSGALENHNDPVMNLTYSQNLKSILELGSYDCKEVAYLAALLMVHSLILQFRNSRQLLSQRDGKSLSLEYHLFNDSLVIGTFVVLRCFKALESFDRLNLFQSLLQTEGKVRDISSTGDAFQQSSQQKLSSHLESNYDGSQSTATLPAIANDTIKDLNISFNRELVKMQQCFTFYNLKLKSK
ncbi:hypothetical protein MIR68_002354 [Amoeboaphelidium protococcarum]|nr:hypothetical protein MIR68_002354 [Amoeboaphelidium protococcarum]